MNAGSFASSILLLLAGFLAGAMNAVAGGGTLVSFPAMIAFGLPPVSAAASNSVAVWPGHAFATLSYRHALRQTSMAKTPLILLCCVGMLGGAIGAAALRYIGNDAYSAAIPMLIGSATVIFALGPAIAKGGDFVLEHSRASSVIAVFLVAGYGGFFGAGLGVMLMAVLLILGVKGDQANNAIKNLIATCITTSSVISVTATGLVAWRPTVVVTIGAILGGLLGGRAAQQVKATYMRRSVVCLGFFLTGVYVITYWL
jgi:uncharacterized protein